MLSALFAGQLTRLALCVSLAFFIWAFHLYFLFDFYLTFVFCLHLDFHWYMPPFPGQLTLLALLCFTCICVAFHFIFVMLLAFRFSLIYSSLRWSIDPVFHLILGLSLSFSFAFSWYISIDNARHLYITLQ